MIQIIDKQADNLIISFVAAVDKHFHKVIVRMTVTSMDQRKTIDHIKLMDKLQLS